MINDVFVSYSSKDKIIADAIVASMEQNHIRCWYAPRDIKPSEDWGKAISTAIEQSRVFLIIFSSNSNRSQRVLDELNLAISQQLPILPFRIENLEPNGAMRLHLSSRHWLDAYSPSWKSHIKKLIEAVSANLAASTAEKGVEIPEIQKRKSTIPRNKINRIMVDIIISILVISASWYGLTQFNKTSDKTQGLSIDITEQVTPTLYETVEIQNTNTIDPGETTQEAINDQCWIAFVSTRSGDPNIWLIEPDGSNLTQLSFNKYGDIKVAWFPDGKQIIFDSNRDGDSEIFVMGADSSNIRQLTVNNNQDMSPDLSPDGDKIAFYSDRNGYFEIYTMNIDGSNVQQVTKEYGLYGNYELLLPYLSWSPYGTQIVFTSDRDGDREIYTVNADGSDIKQLTYNQDMERFPSWSPDGQQIVFDSDRYGDVEIFVMNYDGTNVRQLTSNNRESSEPDWSPDGTQIAFISNRKNDFDIWIMDSDGSNQHQITTDEADDFIPVWSPLCK